MKNSLFITTIEWKGEDIFVFQEKGKGNFTFLRKKEENYFPLEEEEEKKLQKIFKENKKVLKISEPKEYLIKRIKILTFGLVATLASRGKIYPQAGMEEKINTSIEQTVDNLNRELDEDEINQIVAEVTNQNTTVRYDIEMIIRKYSLESSREIIEKNEEEFCRYYDTIIKNRNIIDDIYYVLLNNFSFYKSLGILDYVQTKISDVSIEVDDALCEMYRCKGLFFSPNRIILKSDSLNAGMDHEFCHYLSNVADIFYDFDTKKISTSIKITDVWEEGISMIGFKEALAEDIASARYLYDFKEYASCYLEVINVLQGFYIMFGREEMITAYLSGNFNDYIITQLREVNLTDQEIARLFSNLKIIFYSADKKLGEFIGTNNARTSVVDTMLKIYQNKTGKDWKENIEFQVILESIISNKNLQEKYYLGNQDINFLDMNLRDPDNEKLAYPATVFLNQEYYKMAKSQKIMQDINHARFGPDDKISQLKYTKEYDANADLKVQFIDGKELWYKDGKIVRYYYASYEDSNYGIYETDNYETVQGIKR